MEKFEGKEIEREKKENKNGVQSNTLFFTSCRNLEDVTLVSLFASEVTEYVTWHAAYIQQLIAKHVNGRV